MHPNSEFRSVTRIAKTQRQREGAGFIVRRCFPSMDLELADPFLLLDEMGPVDYAPGEAVGAPDHPHRGFETVTYMLEGALEHRDSAGHHDTIHPGDVQWMTAGAGIVHSEMPSADIQENGGRVHGFQLWINLPSHSKMTRPRYQAIVASKIPEAETEDGLARVRVIAGEALGESAIIDTHTPIVYQDWQLQPGADVAVTVPTDFNAYAFVFQGQAFLDESSHLVESGQLAIFGAGNAVRLRAQAFPSRLLLLAGIPLREPVARYGPFVMNHRQEIVQAIEDFQAGKMGEITRTAAKH